MNKKNDIRNEFIKIFDSLAYKHGRYKIWCDFITMSACAIANSCKTPFFDIREKKYKECVERYDKQEVESIAQLFTLTVLALEENQGQDFLGELFGKLGLNNECRGQFFTPYHIGSLMADIQIDGVAEKIKEQGFVTVNDCCCGAGCLLIAFANSAKIRDINYQKDIIFTAQDVDFIAALMCYIQLSLLGCSAIIKVGDSLSDPLTYNNLVDENVWLTPLFVMRFGQVSKNPIFNKGVWLTPPPQ